MFVRGIRTGTSIYCARKLGSLTSSSYFWVLILGILTFLS